MIYDVGGRRRDTGGGGGGGGGGGRCWKKVVRGKRGREVGGGRVCRETREVRGVWNVGERYWPRGEGRAKSMEDRGSGS